MKLNIKKLKQLIKEELQKEATMHGWPAARPASDADAAMLGMEAATGVAEGKLTKAEKKYKPGRKKEKESYPTQVNEGRTSEFRPFRKIWNLRTKRCWKSSLAFT